MKIYTPISFLASLVLSLTLSVSAHAQLPPNGNFEIWGDFGQWFMSPESWTTSNTELEQFVYQSTDAYEGSYSMQVVAEAQPPYYGEAVAGFSTSAPILTVTGHVKATIDGQAQVAIACERFLNGNLVNTTSWYSNMSIADWTSITFTTEELEADSALIRVIAVGGDFAFGEATIWVDAMNVEEVIPQNIGVAEECSFQIIQSTLGEIQVVGDCPLHPEIILYNQNGQVVARTSDTQTIDTKNLQTGIYILMIATESSRQSQQIVIR